MADMLHHAAQWTALHLQRLRIHYQFRRALGYYGNFENPQTYQEKLQFRKLYGNHRFYAQVADKYRVRDYVAARVGSRYLIPLLGVYDQLHAEDFDALPPSFVIKANHGCKWHQIVADKSRLDVNATVRRFNKYMRSWYGASTGERHYRFIERKIIIEELLEGNTGGCPWDYSFFAYNNPMGFDYSYAIVTPDGRAATFTREGEMLSSRIPQTELAAHLHPGNFAEMLSVARKLSGEFDFVRVDLYSVGNRVYFGELTCTPQQGYGRIEEVRRQKMRDEMWQLDAYNARLYSVPAAYGRDEGVGRGPLPVGAPVPRLP